MSLTPLFGVLIFGFATNLWVCKSNMSVSQLMRFGRKIESVCDQRCRSLEPVETMSRWEFDVISLMLNAWPIYLNILYMNG